MDSFLLKHNTETLNEKSILEDLLSIFQKEFGQEIFEKWFSSLKIVSCSKSEIIFSAPSKFVRDWLIREFIDTKHLKNIINKKHPQIKLISIVYIQESYNTENVNLENNENKKPLNLSKHQNVFAFGTELNTRYNFDHFISVKYNKMAVSMAKIAAGIDAQINFFDDKIPLYIYGGVGMGKTHLAQAIAWQIKNFDGNKKVVYLSAEKFMYHFVQSIRNNDIMNFKEKMRSIDVLIVDDVQFIAGKDSTQQEFMNCFNSLVEDNKQVVLVCDRCPSDLENIDEKLKSRISSGMIVNFKNADYSDRLTILKAKAKEMKQEIDEEILSLIAERVTGSIRDVEGALKKLVANKILEGEEINRNNLHLILKEYIKKSDLKFPNAEKIQKIVADFYGIKVSDLISSKRFQSLVKARQIAMYLAKNITSESLPKIGMLFGGKNHATVIYAIKSVEKSMKEDIKFLQEVKMLEEKIMS